MRGEHHILMLILRMIANMSSSLISLDYHNRFPIYMQIINEIEKYIVLGVLKPHDQIPSIRELASTLGINPNTVRKAYLELENKGVIITVSTKGTFINENIDLVIDNKTDELLSNIKNNISELKNIGINNDVIVDKVMRFIKNDQ